MKRRRLILIAATLVGAPVVLLICLVPYLTLADLSGWRDTLAQRLTKALGREVRIGGGFESDIGITTRLVADDITLASPSWSSEETMVSIQELAIELDLPSLFFGPLTIRQVRITGARVLLERSVDGHGNWELETGSNKKRGAGELELILDHLQVVDLQLVYRSPTHTEPLETAIVRLEATTDETGMLELELDGSVGGTTVELSGRLGTLIGLINRDTLVCDIEGRVGDSTLTADGILGRPPQMLDTDFSFRGKGPDLSGLAALVGFRLPNQDYEIQGRLTRIEGAIRVDAVTARVGPARLSIDGTVGDPPEYAGTALAIQGEGPDLSQFQDLAGVPLPAQPFEITGRLEDGEKAVNLESLHGHVGDSSFELAGRLSTEAYFAGTDLRLKAKGPDASQLASLAGITTVPSESWTLEAGIGVLRSRIRLDDVSASVGDLVLQAHGQVQREPNLVGTQLSIHAEDPDIGHLAGLAGVPDLPPRPVSIDGNVGVHESGCLQTDLVGAVEDIVFEADGKIVLHQDFEKSELQVAIHGPHLSGLSTFLSQPGLPDDPFAATGTVRMVRDGYELEGLEATVADTRLTADGLVAPVEGLAGTRLLFELASPDLEGTGHLGAGLADLPELPKGPFSVSGRISVDESGYELESLRAKLADASVELAGRLGRLPRLVGTDLEIVGKGPDASFLSAFTDATIPLAPFNIHGTFQRTEEGFRCGPISFQLGDYMAEINGTLGEPPRLVGTDVDIRASGPSAGLVGDLVGVGGLPHERFRIAGRFHGTPELFTADGLEILLGASDLEGSLQVDTRGKPTVAVRASSRHLDLTSYPRDLFGRDSNTENEVTVALEGTDTPPTRLLISTDPIDLHWLNRANADIDVTIGALQLPAKEFRDVTIGARLTDGRLEIHHLAMVDQLQGSGSGTLVLEPMGDAYELRTVLDLHALRLDLPGEATVDPASWPPLDLEVRLEARGRSPHELASTANGSLQVVIGKGLIDGRLVNSLTTGILQKLLTAFNPFAKEDDVTELQCGVALLTIEDGLATLEPMALQSAKMTMLGKGRTNLATEELDLEWVTKPRQGIGLSASMITNPYIKLGGTLSHPSVEIKELEAVRSTGIAVATLGVSLVARGLLDRITSEEKVCPRALEQIGQLPEAEKKRLWSRRRP